MKKQYIYVILFCTMIIWGLNVIATKMLVTAFMPVTMTAFRIFTAGVSALIILFLFKKVRMLTRREFGYICLTALFNVVGHHYFLSVGLTQTSASNTGLILGTGPLLTATFAMLLLGDRLSGARMIGILFGIGGVSFIVLEGSGISGISMGDLYIFLCILLQAMSFIIIKKAAAALDPRLMTAYMLIIGSVALFVISLFLEPNGLHSMTTGSLSIWIIFFASAILATSVGHMIYNDAIRRIGAAEASIFLNLTPFFALVGAVLFLGETITANQVVGFLFILLGVYLGSGSFEEWVVRRKRRVSVSR